MYKYGRDREQQGKHVILHFWKFATSLAPSKSARVGNEDLASQELEGPLILRTTPGKLLRLKGSKPHLKFPSGFGLVETQLSYGQRMRKIWKWWILTSLTLDHQTIFVATVPEWLNVFVLGRPRWKGNPGEREQTCKVVPYLSCVLRYCGLQEQRRRSCYATFVKQMYFISAISPDAPATAKSSSLIGICEFRSNKLAED